MLRRSFLQSICAAAASVGLPLKFERSIREPVKPSERIESAKIVLSNPEKTVRFTFAKHFQPHQARKSQEVRQIRDREKPWIMTQEVVEITIPALSSRMFSLLVCDEAGKPIGGRRGSLHFRVGANERPNMDSDEVRKFFRSWMPRSDSCSG